MEVEKASLAGSPPRPEASVRERIVGAVIRGLYDGNYEPGQRLLEAQLTADFGVSRGPVREALNRLEAMGVVTLTPQRGAEIRRLTLDEAIDILVVVQGLVGISARLAAERIDQPGARKRLREAFECLVGFDHSSTAPAYAMARDTFYAAINAIAGNAELRRVLLGIQIHLIRVQFRAVMHTADRRRHRDYRDLVEAIDAGRPASAERAARAHIGRSIAALQAYRQQ